MKRIAGFSASGIYTNVGTMCITASAVLRAQRTQLERAAANKEKKEKKKRGKKEECLLDARKVNNKRLKGEPLNGADLKAVIKYVLPTSGSKEAPSRFTTRRAIEDKLKSLERKWWEYIPPLPSNSETQLDNCEDDLSEAHILLSLATPTEEPTRDPFTCTTMSVTAV